VARAQERVVTGLPSLAGAEGGDATGAHDVSFQGRGNLYVTIGLGDNPAVRAALGPAGALFGTLVRASGTGNGVSRPTSPRTRRP
jgi:hypothetical protein